MTNPAPTPSVAEVQQNIDNKINKPLPKAPDFDKEVLEPLRVEQKKAAERAKVAEELAQQEAAKKRLLAERVSVKPPQPIVASSEVRVSQSLQSDGLVGSLGRARYGGNCVNEPGVNNPFNNTNPISWLATSQTPWIGATALFRYNHVGVVTGIWSNGDIEIRHQNYQGNQTRFPREAFKGFR